MGAAVGVAALVRYPTFETYYQKLLMPSTQFISIGGSSQELFKLKTPITIGLSTAVLCDLIISITMIVIVSIHFDNSFDLLLMGVAVGEVQGEHGVRPHKKSA